MATIPTESDRFGLSTQDNSAAVAATAAQQPRPESFLAEVPVLVHASHRSTAPNDGGKVQTIREETSTLVIFPRGAVLRLASTLSRGDLVVLTNLQNRADMLCRAAYVREQAGGGSYIELEFTQRSAAFWNEGPAKANPARSSPSPSLSGTPTASNSAPTLAPVLKFPGIAKPPVSPAPLSVSPSSLENEPPILAADAAPLSASPLPEPSVVPITPVAVPKVENDSEPITTAAREAFQRAEASQSLAPSEPAASEVPLLPARRGSFVQKLKDLSHSPMIWVFGAALTILAFLGENYLIGHRSSSSPTPDTATSRAIYPAQPAAARTGETPSSAEPITLNSISVVSSTSLKDHSAEDAAGNKGAEDQPHRNAIRIGTLAPITTKPSIAASSEPPPALPAQGPNDADYLIGAGSLSGAAAAGGPAPIATSALGTNAPAAPASNYQAPKMVSSTPPVYPAAARERGIQGVVVVDATIDATGEVTSATVLSGSPLLRQSALDAVRQWKYQPAELNGQPVLSHAKINVNFAR